MLLDQPPPDLLGQVGQRERRQRGPGDGRGRRAAGLGLVDEQAPPLVPEPVDQSRGRRGAAERLQGE